MGPEPHFGADVRVRYLTFSVPFIPAAEWPGTVQR